MFNVMMCRAKLVWSALGKMKGNSGAPKEKRFKKRLKKIGRKCLKAFIVLADSLKGKLLEGPT